MPYDCAVAISEVIFTAQISVVGGEDAGAPKARMLKALGGHDIFKGDIETMTPRLIHKVNKVVAILWYAIGERSIQIQSLGAIMPHFSYLTSKQVFPMTINKPTDKGSIAQRSYRRFFRLSIAGKLLLGYLSLASLIVLISLFTLSTLEKLNSINKSIIKNDLPLMEAGDKMIDSLLAQESYGRRYTILQSEEMLNLFKERGA